MLTFESGAYTRLTVFPKAEYGTMVQMELTGGEKRQIEQIIGRRPATFFLESDREYVLRCDGATLIGAYLHGGVSLLKKGIQYLVGGTRTYKAHFAPPSGWVGGPSLFFRRDGMYHLFYLWNPFAETPDTIYWGHAAGENICKLRPMPIAAMPPEELQLSDYRRGGAIGGTVDFADEIIRILYTNCVTDTDKRLVYKGTMEMKSRDMLYFSEPVPSEDGIAGYNPRMTGEKLLSCGTLHGKGVIYTHEKKDTIWKKNGVLYKDARTAYFHTGDFFPIGRTHALIFEGADGIPRWTVGTYSEEKFRKRVDGILDAGAFCMPCTYVDGDRRVLLGSIGQKAISLPRYIGIKHGQICSSPVAEVTRMDWENTESTKRYVFTGNTDTFSACFSQFRLSAEKELFSVWSEEKIWQIQKAVKKIEVFVDGDIVEIFVNNGEWSVSFVTCGDIEKKNPVICGNWHVDM